MVFPELALTTFFPRYWMSEAEATERFFEKSMPNPRVQPLFDEAKRLEKKVRKEGMDLQDFLSSMKQIEKMGPLEGILKMLPGVNTKALKQMKADPKRMKHVEAIVLSMTPEERKNPGVINGSRRSRIAKGAGRPIRARS